MALRSDVEQRKNPARRVIPFLLGKRAGMKGVQIDGPIFWMERSDRNARDCLECRRNCRLECNGKKV